MTKINVLNTEILSIVKEDPWLSPYAHDVGKRYQRYLRARNEIEEAEGSLLNFAKGHYYY